MEKKRLLNPNEPQNEPQNIEEKIRLLNRANPKISEENIAHSIGIFLSTLKKGLPPIFLWSVDIPRDVVWRTLRINF